MLELIIIVLALVAVIAVPKLVSRVTALEKQAREFADQIELLKRGQLEGFGRPPGSAAGSPGEVRPALPVEESPQDPPLTRTPEISAPTAAGSVPPVTLAPAISGSPSLPPSLPSTTSLEERLGTRWSVWVGGMTLGLGGLLLVRYSIEQGYFGPTTRVIMGLILAAILAAAGEWFRRSEQDLGLTAIPSAHIPGVLTAAGTVTAFGAVYAGHALYGLIGSATAFLLLGAIGVVTLLAAALHGPALGALGLAGSYGAPMLVSSQHPNPWPVVIYLAVVAASSMALARMRRWLWLAMLAVGGAVLWGVVFQGQMAVGESEWRLAGYLHVLLQLGLAAAFLAVAPNRSVADREAAPDPIAAGAIGALTLLAMVMLATGRFDLRSSMPFVLAAGAMLMATAWLSAPAVSGALFSGLVILTANATWPGLKVPPASLPEQHELWQLLSIPENITSFLTFTTLAPLALCAAATLRLRLTRQLSAPMTALYALAATVTLLLALVIAYLRITQFDASISFAFAGAALATIFAIIASRFEREEDDQSASDRLATGTYAAAAIAAFSFGLVAFLERGYLTVAFALAALGTACVATGRDIPLLRHVVTALAIVVLGRIAWEPRIMGASVGTWPMFNWLLVGYGGPALAFWACARQLEAHGGGAPARIADAVAVLLAGLLAFFQIRHALHGGDVLAQSSSHVEMGLMALVGMGMSYALLRLDLGRANLVFRAASVVFGIVAGLFIAIGLGIAENPLFVRQPVRGPVIFSSLMLAYLLPSAMAAIVARASRGIRRRWFVTGIGVLAALLMFGYVTLEVRHAFQGQYLDRYAMTTGMEQWSYSAAWLLLGIVLLGYGILRHSLAARFASAALVVLSVAKVFLFDLAGLSGIWRPLSFIVLGLVLIGIGLTYQKLLFGKRTQAPGPSDRPGRA